MCAEPIREISTIHGQKISQRKIVLGPDKNPLSKLSGELFHIKAQITVGTAKRFGFVIRGTEVLCDMDKGQLSCGDKTAPLTAIDGKLYLELVVDRNSIEIYANGGEVYMPMGGILPAENKTLSMFSRDGLTNIDSLEVWKLKSIWN
jgi:sucrose-6-phosphate hydrolase SacC (GH32 family)